MEFHDIDDDGIDPQVEKASKNVNLMLLGRAESRKYAIYVNGSGVHYYKRMIFADHPELLRHPEPTTDQEFIDYAVKIGKVLNLEVHETNFDGLTKYVKRHL